MPVTENGNIIYKQIDEINWNNESNYPVTGKFRRYAKVVYSYEFSNEKSDKVTLINATPNHRFYVKNKKHFIAIDDIGSGDELISDDGSLVRLICANGKLTHCGRRYNNDDIPVAVYNMEVYARHMYFVGNDFNILVHNAYDCKYCSKSFTAKSVLTIHERIHTGEKPFACTFGDCRKSYADNKSLINHEKTHLLSPDQWKTENLLSSYPISPETEQQIINDVFNEIPDLGNDAFPEELSDPNLRGF